MKKLLLLRHGNAASRTGKMNDHDRPLDNLGRKQITNIADKLIKKPDLIFSSTAARAVSSAEIIKESIQSSKEDKKLSIKIITTDNLYSASIFEYIDILKTQTDSLGSILIVAHNPTISGFISRFTRKHIGMGTGYLCLIELDIEKWADLDFNSPIITYTLIKP